MISVQDFDTLAPGDVIEVGSAFRPLTDEPVVLRVRAKVGDRIEFDMMLFGINLGPAECALVQGEVLEWSAA